MNSSDFKRRIVDAHELRPSLWVKGMVNETGFPLEFTNHRFMIDIYNDLSPYQVILKAPQVGATTMHVLKALWVASHLKKQIIYTLPTVDAMRAMVGSGFNRIITQNEALKELVVDNDTMEYKQVGEGMLRFRGAAKGTQAMMVPSDLNIHDEVDASDADIITQYETRLQAKADGWRWYFSHPSLVSKGVDVYWAQSDKKEWFVKCKNGHEHLLEWPESIAMGQYVCRECKTPLTDEERRAGQWKPTAKGMFSGYHISQLMCPWINAEKIIEASQDQNKGKQYFYNYVLGLPFADSNDRIDPKDVLKNVVSRANDQQGQIVWGVDPGLPFWVVGGTKNGLFYNADLSGKDPQIELERLLLRFPNSIMIIDQGGDFRSRVLMDKYPGRVFICFYRQDRKSAEPVKWNDDGSVVVDKHQMFTLLFDSLRDGGRINLNGTEDDWREFASHFNNFLRVKEDTPLGPKYIWESRKPDHYAHAFLYAMVGLLRFGDQEASIIQSRDWLTELPKVDFGTSMKDFL